MPHCYTCGERFRGTGNYCIFHNNYRSDARFQEPYNYSSDSADPSSIRYRSNLRRRPRTFHVTNAYDNYDQYNNQYLNTHNLVQYGPGNTGNVDAALAQPLVHSFTMLSHAHIISSMTYSVTPNGVQSLTAEANLEREQCTVCRKWFPDHQKLEHHQYEFSVGCDEHKVCIRKEDVLWHATRERHERCFVRGCPAEYRKEGGWKCGVIEKHMKSWHNA